MNYLLVDLFALLLIVVGLILTFKPPRARPGRDRDDDPRLYIRRIGGMMLTAFGLAIGVMFTTFHFAE
jgi:hypothetical protein